MRINSKSIITLLIAFLMIFGTAFYSYAVKSTSIHLKLGLFTSLTDSTIFCILDGYQGTDTTQHTQIDGKNVTKILMDSKGVNYSTKDLALYANRLVLYFEINNVLYRVGEEIIKKAEEGKNGEGTALFEVAKLPKFSVSYNGNGFTGGTVPAQPTQYFAGSNVPILDNTGLLTKINYDFAGWNTKADGTGIDYSVGDNFIMPYSDVILFAQWEEVVKKVTYKSGIPDDVPVTVNAPEDNTPYYTGEGVIVQEKSNDLTWENHDFVGWQYNGVIYSNGSIVIMGYNDIEFIGTWKLQNTSQDSFNVMYHSDSIDGTVTNYSHSDVGIASGYEITLKGLPENFEGPKNKSFIGWSTTASGNVQSKSGDKVIVNSNLDFYAVWENNPTNKVFYYGNGNTGGEVPKDDSEYYSNKDPKPIAAAIGNLSKTNHTFDSWNTMQDGTGSKYEVGDEIVISEQDVYLYAIWNLNPTFKVTYNANDGQGNVPEDNDTYFADSQATVLDKGNLKKDGYDFKGWNSSEDSKTYNANAKITIKGNVTLTAVWVEKSTPTTSNNPPGETTNQQVTNPPATTEQPTTQPPTPEPTTVAASEEEIEIEEEVGAPAGAASSIVETTEELVELDDPIIPLSVLPQTGQLPVELFYGVGGLITAAGVYLRRKSS